MIRRIHQYRFVFNAPDGRDYTVRLYGSPRGRGIWAGWFLFIPVDRGPFMRTDTETEQSSLRDLLYWGGGITPAYLEGAFGRAFRIDIELDRTAHPHAPGPSVHA